VIRLRHYLSSPTARGHLILVANLLFHIAIVCCDCREMMLFQRTVFKAKRLGVEVKRRCRAAAEYINLRGAKRDDTSIHTVDLSQFVYTGRIAQPGPPPAPLLHQKPYVSQPPEPSQSQIIAPSQIGRSKSISRSGFCAYCQNFIDDWSQILSRAQHSGPSVFNYQHHSGLSSLQASARIHGCKLCCILHQQILDHGLGSPNYALESPGTLELSRIKSRPGPYHWRLLLWSQGGLVTYIRILPAKDPGMDERLSIARNTQHPSDAKCELALSKVPLNYSTSLALTKQWLKEWRASHENCMSMESRPVSSRLLYIAPGQLRLSVGRNTPDDISYVTLSHCWGGLDILRLTKDTLESFQLCIPLGSLCKTFHGAIFVTRYLGFSYLWIDSLCIIQDDGDDWAKEAPLMSTVYGGASLNIAAASAKDGNDGPFSRRLPLTSRKSATRVKVEVNSETKAFQFADGRPCYRCVKSQPLAQRAWALQERILATRTIHSSKTELFWECRTKCACETFPEFLPRDISDTPDFLQKDLHPDWKVWDSIVMLYSVCKLTYSKDKLVAISGIVQHVQSITKDRYLAGLWCHDLEETLCWKLLKAPERKSTVYRAPSWSWALIDGMVMTTVLTLSSCATSTLKSLMFRYWSLIKINLGKSTAEF
jgi:hypothetical protein